MGTLYDLLGALPSDDAEGLRTAFRKAAKATHPDTNPDNPDAALRFRELVRAYDILTDAEQRATYDQLLAIALQPPAAKAVRTYEVIGKFASNTMAATIISAVLVGGYTLLGMFSKPPGAAEIVVDSTAGEASQSSSAAARRPRSKRNARPARGRSIGRRSDRDRCSHEGGNAASIGRFEPVPGFNAYNLGIQYYPRFAAAYLDRGIVLYSVGDFNRPFAEIVRPKRSTDSKKSKNATPAPRKPLLIVPTVPERPMPITAALTPG